MSDSGIEKKETIIFGDEFLERFGGSIRLDAFLLKMFPDYSRTYFQKLIADDFVTVNGKKVNKSFVLRLDDEVAVAFPKPPKISVEPVDVPFEIIDIKKDFLIVNKPAGLLVHAAGGGASPEGSESKKVHSSRLVEPEPTLVSGLCYRFNEFGEFDETERPGIVHRLDKNTSGLMIVARNPKAQMELSGLFRERRVSKTYLAVVRGHPDPEGKIDLPVGRHPVERNKMSHVSYVGKPSLTYYKVLNYYRSSFGDCSLVEVSLVTGRTHQIRVHFAALGHGLLGDQMYGVRSKQIKRQALHSWKLAFDFRGEAFSYSCPVPDDFKKLLHSMRSSIIKI